MKRILALLLAVLTASVLLPIGALADPVGARYSAEDVYAMGLSAGEVFTVEYRISEGSMLSGCELKIYYPAQYVTPVAFCGRLDTWNAEGEPDYTGFECELVNEDDAGSFTLFRAWVDPGFYLDNGESGTALVSIDYELHTIPATGELPMDDIGAYAELEIAVISSEYYLEELSAVAPHEPAKADPARVYLPLAPVPQPIAVTYTGAAVDARELTVGDTFNWTLAVSDRSYMWSGMWLVDHPEEYLTPAAYSVTWEGGLTSLIMESADNGAQTSDVPAFVCNPDYEGQTGGSPVGEPGNRYSIVGMYLTTFDHNGLQAGGEFLRLTYEITALPEPGACPADDIGSYVEIPVTVLESRYWKPGEAPALNGSHVADHQLVWVENGRVYLPENAAEHTVTFIGFGGEVIAEITVADGCPAEAPEAPTPIEAGPLTYHFMGWSGDLSCVTEDMTVTAVYICTGDIDGDGELTFTDISALYSYVLGSGSYDVPLVIGDVNGDGEVTFADIGALYAVILG